MLLRNRHSSIHVRVRSLVNGKKTQNQQQQQKLVDMVLQVQNSYHYASLASGLPLPFHQRFAELSHP